ncbi:hypothetical protein GCM10023405_04060 [Streptomonospora salina]
MEPKRSDLIPRWSIPGAYGRFRWSSVRDAGIRRGPVPDTAARNSNAILTVGRGEAERGRAAAARGLRPPCPRRARGAGRADSIGAAARRAPCPGPRSEPREYSPTNV